MIEAYVSSYVSKEQVCYLSLLFHGERLVTIPLLIVSTYKKCRDKTAVLQSILSSQQTCRQKHTPASKYTGYAAYEYIL